MTTSGAIAFAETRLDWFDWDPNRHGCNKSVTERVAKSNGTADDGGVLTMLCQPMSEPFRVAKRLLNSKF